MHWRRSGKYKIFPFALPPSSGLVEYFCWEKFLIRSLTNIIFKIADLAQTLIMKQMLMLLRQNHASESEINKRDS